MKVSKRIGAGIVWTILLIGLATAWSEEKKIKLIWLTNFEQAMQQSRKEGKPLLMNFSGSDWCKPCIMLTEEVFESDAFQKFATVNLVLLNLDFPRKKLAAEQLKHNERMAAKYNSDGQFPLVVILGADERIIGRAGYRRGGPEKYIMHLKSLMSEDRRRRTAQ